MPEWLALAWRRKVCQFPATVGGARATNRELNMRPANLCRLAAGVSLVVLGAAPAMASAGAGSLVKEIVGQTSTATVAGGGDPIYIPSKPQYSGNVALRMNYGSAGTFVCSGTLISKMAVVTAAHCVSDGTSARPLATTVFFYDGPNDSQLYFEPGATAISVAGYNVNPLYSGEVVDENDIAILKLAQAAPDYAPIATLSSTLDLTGLDHEIVGYGLRSTSGGTNGTLTGFAAGAGRLRYAGNRFDFRLGDPDFEGFFDGYFGPQAVNNVWISDFDNGTAFRDGSCNLSTELGPEAPDIFSKPVFSTGKYCNLGIGAFEGIGAGGDSGGGYYVDGQLAAVHSFAWWLRADESANRFGQLKGAVSVAYHSAFIAANIPEPSTWAMMIAGFGLVGHAARRRRREMGQAAA
jgi:hypothetical protein